MRKHRSVARLVRIPTRTSSIAVREDRDAMSNVRTASGRLRSAMSEHRSASLAWSGPRFARCRSRRVKIETRGTKCEARRADSHRRLANIEASIACSGARLASFEGAFARFGATLATLVAYSASVGPRFANPRSAAAILRARTHARKSMKQEVPGRTLFSRGERIARTVRRGRPPRLDGGSRS